MMPSALVRYRVFSSTLSRLLKSSPAVSKNDSTLCCGRSPNSPLRRSPNLNTSGSTRLALVVAVCVGGNICRSR
jgi:hypothetical protein